MNELARYHRQMLLPEVGEAGQRRLLGSRAVVVGCGALGTVAAELLARAGVGTLTLVDRDIVELTNLQRQTLFDEADARAGTPKAEAAARRLARINSDVRLDPRVADVNAASVRELLGTAGFEASGIPGLPGIPGIPGFPGVVLDCTDNFETRYLLNDAAVSAGVALVYAGAVGTSAVQMTVVPGRSACLRCVFEEPPAPGSAPTCDTAGVLGPLTAMVASMQAAEAIKVLAGRTELVSTRLTAIDLRSAEIRQVDLRGARRAECPCCGLRRFEFLDGARGSAATVLCGRGAVQVLPSGRAAVELAGLGERLRAHGEVHVTASLLRATLDHERAESGQAVELTVFADGRAIIRGAADTAAARAIYARYVGG